MFGKLHIAIFYYMSTFNSPLQKDVVSSCVFVYSIYKYIYIYIYGIVLTTAFTVKFVMAHNFILLQLSPFDLRVNREGWLCIYVFIWYLYVFIYIFIWHVETDKKIFCNLLFWSAWSTLVTLCPFIRQPFWNSPSGYVSGRYCKCSIRLRQLLLMIPEL